MKAIKTLIITLGIAAAISPALAATDGMPPNIGQDTVRSVQIESDGVRTAPQYLHGLGEVSLVPNPGFVGEKAAAPMRMGRITPLRGYVGA